MQFNMVFQLSEMMANQGPNLPETMTIEIPVASKKHTTGYFSAVGVHRPRNSSDDGSTTEFEVKTKRQSPQANKITSKEQPAKNTKNKAQN